MNRLLVVVIPDLPERHTASIREAAVRHGFDIRFFEEAEQSLPALQDAEVILGADPFLSRNAPNLRWLCSHFAGVNQFLEKDAFAAQGVLLTNSSGAYGVTIAEHVIMLLLEILRRVPEYQGFVREQKWVRRLPVRAIYGSRVTLLGTGDIGQETVRRLRGFSPERIVGVNRTGRNPEGLFDRVIGAERLDEILPGTDLLISSLPGTPGTFHMLSEARLKLLPDDAVIVNVGRGSVIDEKALEKELRSGRLFAGLDVFETEPIPAGSSLWTCPRLVITPHVAGDTTLPHTLDRIVELFLEDFENYCAGRLLARRVSRDLGY